MKPLPSPELVSSYVDEGSPGIAAMRLRWPDDPECGRALLWTFPEQVRLVDTLPERFGVRVVRRAIDAYEVTLLWNRVTLGWPSARRSELLGSAIHRVLASLGTELAQLLDQPVAGEWKQAG